jgi:hypothetical protein
MCCWIELRKYVLCLKMCSDTNEWEGCEWWKLVQPARYIDFRVRSSSSRVDEMAKRKGGCGPRDDLVEAREKGKVRLQKAHI